MTPEKFSALLTLIIPQLVAGVERREDLSEKEAIRQVYQSGFLRDLTDESTKLWHYGAAALLALYEGERQGKPWDYLEAA